MLPTIRSVREVIETRCLRPKAAPGSIGILARKQHSDEQKLPRFLPRSTTRIQTPTSYVSWRHRTKWSRRAEPRWSVVLRPSDMVVMTPSSSAVWEIGMSIAITSFGRASNRRLSTSRDHGEQLSREFASCPARIGTGSTRRSATRCSGSLGARAGAMTALGHARSSDCILRFSQ
jgi:hypothetical protein